jgi:1-acyl-sn-glycerol-3-phosphate acyltransferase
MTAAASPATSVPSETPVAVPIPPRIFDPDARSSAILRNIVRFTINTLIRPWIGPAVENAPDWKTIGPCIIAPNHTSFADPILVQSVIPVDVRFLMTETIYRVPLMRWSLRSTRRHSCPRRSGAQDRRDEGRADGDALRKTGRDFPEGSIARDGVIQPGQPGVVALMVKARVPVIPVAVIGAYRLLPRRANFPRASWVRVRFGTPILPPEKLDRDGTRDFAAAIMAEIARLSKET